MSQENVEIMRASNEAWAAADSARLREMYDPGAVMRTEEDWPEAGPHFGREAVLRFFGRAPARHPRSTARHLGSR